MNQRGANILLNCFFYAAAQTLCATCVAQTPDRPVVQLPLQAVDTNSPDRDPEETQKKEPQDSNVDNMNALGPELLKNLLSDQKAIWTSPAHLRWADGTWLFPLAAVTGGFFATDRAVPPALSTDQKKLSRYVSVSNYGLYSMIGAGAVSIFGAKFLTTITRERRAFSRARLRSVLWPWILVSNMRLEEHGPTRNKVLAISSSMEPHFLLTIQLLPGPSPVS